MKDRDLQLDEPSLERKAWVTPQRTRMVAGLAEFGDVAHVDSQPGYS